MEAYSYCIVEHLVNSSQFLLGCLTSLSIPICSLRIRIGLCCLPGAIRYDATDRIQWYTMPYYDDGESKRMSGDAIRTRREPFVDPTGRV